MPLALILMTEWSRVGGTENTRRGILFSSHSAAAIEDGRWRSYIAITLHNEVALLSFLQQLFWSRIGGREIGERKVI